MDAWTMRAVILVLGAILLAVIYFSGRPRSDQGRRVARKAERVEPQFGASAGSDSASEKEFFEALDLLSREISSDRKKSDVDVDLDSDGDGDADRASFRADSHRPTPVEPLMSPLRSPVGARKQEQVDRIVTLFVMAEEGSTFNGADVVVAAEKTGLEFGDMSVFHRLVESRVDKGPVFSMANLLKPGSFDMQQVHKLETPGLSLFMTLPGPLTALDAWDAMLPTAQRLAELLNGLVLDEERNAIGRQRIQFMRDELRAYDRDKEKNTIRKHW